MDNHILEKIKAFKKKREWKNVLKLYDIHLNSNQELDTEIYAGYAKALRMNGDSVSSEKVLQSKLSLYPSDEHLLVELSNLYDYLDQWKDNEKVVEQLISINPYNPNYYFKLGRAHAFMKNEYQAESAHQKGLEIKHGTSIQELINKIEYGIVSEDKEQIVTKYKYLSGNNNFGVLIHKHKKDQYFTKIFRAKRSSKREKMFYKNICSDFPVLKTIVPSYVISQKLDNIQYLTIEKINKSNMAASLEQVIEACQLISNIKYKNMIKKYPNPSYVFLLQAREITVVTFFTQIHKESVNQKLISGLKDVAKQKNYPETAFKIIDKIETLVISEQLYTFVDPEKHYSLLHGDLTSFNIMVEKDTNDIRIFDWALFRIGPHFIDVARFVTEKFFPYSEVKEKYIFNDEVNLSLIEQIFFLYSYVSLYFVVLKNEDNNLDDLLFNFIYPALEDMEKCVLRFKIERHEEEIEFLKKENVKEKKHNKNLKKDLSKIKRERNALQMKLQGILNSKSWKTTKPLRKLTQYMKKFL